MSPTQSSLLLLIAVGSALLIGQWEATTQTDAGAPSPRAAEQERALQTATLGLALIPGVILAALPWLAGAPACGEHGGTCVAGVDLATLLTFACVGGLTALGLAFVPRGAEPSAPPPTTAPSPGPSAQSSAQSSARSSARSSDGESARAGDPEQANEAAATPTPPVSDAHPVKVAEEPAERPPRRIGARAATPSEIVEAAAARLLAADTSVVVASEGVEMRINTTLERIAAAIGGTRAVVGAPTDGPAHLLAGPDALHTHALALALAGRGYQAVLFVDDLDEEHPLLLASLAAVDSIGIVEHDTAYAKSAAIAAICPPDDQIALIEELADRVESLRARQPRVADYVAATSIVGPLEPMAGARGAGGPGAAVLTGGPELRKTNAGLSLFLPVRAAAPDADSPDADAPDADAQFTPKGALASATPELTAQNADSLKAPADAPASPSPLPAAPDADRAAPDADAHTTDEEAPVSATSPLPAAEDPVESAP